MLTASIQYDVTVTARDEKMIKALSPVRDFAAFAKHLRWNLRTEHDGHMAERETMALAQAAVNSGLVVCAQYPYAYDMIVEIAPTCADTDAVVKQVGLNWDKGIGFLDRDRLTTLVEAMVESGAAELFNDSDRVADWLQNVSAMANNVVNRTLAAQTFDSYSAAVGAVETMAQRKTGLRPSAIDVAKTTQHLTEAGVLKFARAA